MSKYGTDTNTTIDTDTTTGCIAVCIAFVIALAIRFVMPWVCIMGWAPIAATWNLPTFTYWQWFWMSWLIRWLFKGSGGTTISRSK